MGIVYNNKSIITDKISLYLDAANNNSFDTSQVVKSVAPNTWTAVTTMAENGWRGICYGNGKFVATSLDGTNRVAWSTDGINWTSASASEQHKWYGVTYGNGKFVAVCDIAGGVYNSDIDRVMYSTNGISWTTANATYDHRWVSVCYGNGYFVAVAEDDNSGGSNANKRVMYSTNGSSWTAGPVVQGNSWKSVAYGNGKFVAVASSGVNRVMYASEDDPSSWSTASAAENNYWFDVCYGDGKFVAVANDGTNQVMYSTDGSSWTSASAASSGSWFGVTYGNGYFVAVRSGTSLDTGQVMYSTDGINWTTASSIISGEPWAAIAYGNGKFVATQLMEGDQGGLSGTLTYQGICCSDGFTYPTANDISSKGHSAVINSDEPQPSGSQSLFEFNGINDHIEFLSNSDIAFDADFTVEIWVKFDNLGADRPIWETRSSTTANNGFLIYVNSDGGLYMKTGSGFTIANSSAGIVTDTWYHIAVSRIGGTVTQYLNAVQSGGQAVGTVTNYSNDDLYIGKDVASTLKMNGKLSQVRVYKGKGLTTAEVNQNFDAHKKRFGL